MVCVGTGKYSMCLYAFTIEIKLLRDIKISCSWYICMLYSVLVFGKIEKARMVKGFECQPKEFVFYSGSSLKTLCAK